MATPRTVSRRCYRRYWCGVALGVDPMPSETLTSLIDRLPPVVNRGVLAQILARLPPGAQCPFVSVLLEIAPRSTGGEWAIDMQMSENADPEIGRLLASLFQP